MSKNEFKESDVISAECVVDMTVDRSKYKNLDIGGVYNVLGTKMVLVNISSSHINGLIELRFESSTTNPLS